MAEDSRYVLSRLGAPKEHKHLQPKHFYGSSDRTSELFSKLTQNEIRRLYEVYRLDFALSGYSASEYFNKGRKQ